MRKSMLISLILLSILVDRQGQGIRLIKGSLSAEQHEAHEEKSDFRRSNLGFGKGKAKEKKHSSESGSNRKLMTKTSSTSSTTTTTTTSKTDNNDHHGNGQSNSHRLGGEEKKFSVNSSPVTQHPPETVPDHYPDILDIAGMDYSPARRKSPIHN